MKSEKLLPVIDKFKRVNSCLLSCAKSAFSSWILEQAVEIHPKIDFIIYCTDEYFYISMANLAKKGNNFYNECCVELSIS